MADNSEDEERFSREVGPRKVGGRYFDAYWGAEYEVLQIDRGPRESWPPWEITIRWADGRKVSHCTAWEPGRDRVIRQPD